MSRVVNPVGRNWKTEEKADYSTIASTCRCNPGSMYSKGASESDHCYCTGNSQAVLHCESGV